MDTLKKIFKLISSGIILCIPVGIFMIIEILKDEKSKKKPEKTINRKVNMKEGVVVILLNQKTNKRRIINA